MGFKSTNINKTVFFLIFTVIVSGVSAQDTITGWDIDNPYVKWIGQFPPDKQIKKEFRLKKRISKLIFGNPAPLLNKPFGVFANNTDDFWILEQGNQTLINVKNNTGKTPRYISKSDFSYKSLVSICSNGSGALFFTDSNDEKVYELNPDKKLIEIFNDSCALKQPTGIAWSKKKQEIWIAETSAHRIAVLDKDGNLKFRFGQRGNAKGQFNFPTFIWIDNNGIAYIVDSMNFRVQTFDENGKFISTFGEMGDATGYFARPKGIATDSYANIYVVDALFHVVQIFDKSGNFLYRIGVQGHEKGQFWMPVGIYIDKNNFIYVADSYNARIQIFKLIRNGKNKYDND